MEVSEPPKLGKVVVTGRAPFTARKTRAALRNAVFPARVVRPGFRSVFVVEAEGESPQLAEQIYRGCSRLIGRATAVLAEVESKPESIKEAAVRIGTEQIEPKESFSFRLFKRGSHNLQEDTPKIECEIGGAIHDAIQRKTGESPLVRLCEPDVSVSAEVLGPITLVGIVRKKWQAGAAAEAKNAKDSQTQVLDLRAKEDTSQSVGVGPAPRVNTKTF